MVVGSFHVRIIVRVLVRKAYEPNHWQHIQSEHADNVVVRAREDPNAQASRSGSSSVGEECRLRAALFYVKCLMCWYQEMLCIFLYHGLEICTGVLNGQCKVEASKAYGGAACR